MLAEAGKPFSVKALLSQPIKQQFLFRELGCKVVGGCANSWMGDQMYANQICARENWMMMSVEISVFMSEGTDNDQCICLKPDTTSYYIHYFTTLKQIGSTLVHL